MLPFMDTREINVTFLVIKKSGGAQASLLIIFAQFGLQ